MPFTVLEQCHDCFDSHFLIDFYDFYRKRLPFITFERLILLNLPSKYSSILTVHTFVLLNLPSRYFTNFIQLLRENEILLKFVSRIRGFELKKIVIQEMLIMIKINPLNIDLSLNIRKEVYSYHFLEVVDLLFYSDIELHLFLEIKWLIWEILKDYG